MSNPHPHKKRAPARGSGGDKPSGGYVETPAQGMGKRLQNGRFEGALKGQGGALGYQRALDVVQESYRQPLVEDGKVIVTPDGGLLEVVNPGVAANVLNAAKILMDRDWGAPVQRVLKREIHTVEDLTDEELDRLIEAGIAKRKRVKK